MNLEPWEENTSRGEAWRKFLRDLLGLEADEVLNEQHHASQFSAREMWSAFVGGYKAGVRDAKGKAE